MIFRFIYQKHVHITIINFYCNSKIQTYIETNMQKQEPLTAQLTQIISGEYKLYNFKGFLSSIRSKNPSYQSSQITQIEQMLNEKSNRLIFTSPSIKKHMLHQQNTYSPLSVDKETKDKNNQQMEQKIIKKYQKLFQGYMKDSKIEDLFQLRYDQGHQSIKTLKNYNKQKSLQENDNAIPVQYLSQQQDVIDEPPSMIEANNISISTILAIFGASKYYFDQQSLEGNMKNPQKESQSQDKTRIKHNILQQIPDKSYFRHTNKRIFDKKDQKISFVSKGKSTYKRSFTEVDEQGKFEYTEIHQRKNKFLLEKQLQVLQQHSFYKNLKGNVRDDILMWYEKNKKKIYKATQNIYKNQIIGRYIQRSQMNVRLNQLLMLKVDPDRWTILMAESAYAKLKNRFL